jgi:hypothetical protein
MKTNTIKVDTGIAVVRGVDPRNGEKHLLPDDEPDSAKR